MTPQSNQLTKRRRGHGEARPLTLAALRPDNLRCVYGFIVIERNSPVRHEEAPLALDQRALAQVHAVRFERSKGLKNGQSRRNSSL